MHLTCKVYLIYELYSQNITPFPLHLLICCCSNCELGFGVSFLFCCMVLGVLGNEANMLFWKRMMLAL